MKLLRFIKNSKFFILAVISLITLQTNSAQIKINGLKIPEVKILGKKENKKTEAKPESTPNNSQTNNQTTSAQPDANTNQDDPPEWWLNVMLSDINKAKEQVDAYTPEGKIYLVSSPSAPWLLRAVSAKARETYGADKKINDWRKANADNKFDKALNELAASAAKKLPNYIPNNKNFALRDVALEKMMKAKLKNPATLKILKIGIFHSAWQIEKNDIGIPRNRYREAFIWGKDSADDHNYCHLYGFVIQQNYSGGGTYGATYAYLNTDALFGCPAK